ncbi:MAG: sensor histidine kinase [Oscillospiraceae bacterium]|nr:sensor histidine kinase [Oscillospiraceae bacterium]
MRMNTLLLLSIIGTVVVVLLSAMLLFFQTYRRALIRNAETSGQRTIAQVSNTVDTYLDDIDAVMNTLYTELEAGETARTEFFDAFLRIRPDVIAVSTYNGAGGLVRCYALDREPLRTPGSNLSLDASRLEAEPEGYVSAPHVVSLFAGYYPWAITMVSPVQTNQPEEWVALDISCSNISDYINDVGIGRRGYCFLLDTDGNIVYHPQQQLIYSDLKSENVELISTLADGSHVEGSVIYTLQTLDNERWRVVGVSYVEDVIFDSLWELGSILIIAALLILAATFLISAVLSKELSRPLQDLAGAMEQFEQDADNFSYEPGGGTREVRDLSESFRHMVLRVQQLMGTVRQEEVNLRKTELRALQAQINPHFLYNTLDSISWMCEQGKNAEAVQMVNALARLFRISISRGHELIPIRSELQHAESYLQIQAHRYKNQFVYRFDVDEECLDYLCNKITLQPIIENAIYHGINGLVDDGEIAVSVKGEGEDIVFTVADNGSGMTAEQIDAIMSKERSDHAGIGIKNVNDRLKIYFGSAYGITIDSVPDEGTRVHIRMPRVREEAPYENK